MLHFFCYTKESSGNIALHPHLDHEWLPNNSLANIKKLAATLPMPSYAIDDQTAIKVTNANIEVILEGNWKLLCPAGSNNAQAVLL